MAKGAFGAQVELKGAGSGAGTPSTGITGLTSRQVLFGSPSGGIAQDIFLQYDSSNGRLGIGTTAPTARFSAIPSNAGEPTYDWYTSAGVHSGLINSSGHLGIGTTAPTAALDVLTTAGRVRLSGFGGYGGVWAGAGAPTSTNYSLLSNGSETFINAVTGNIIALRIDNLTKVTLSSLGDLGVGVAPAARLHSQTTVNGNAFLVTATTAGTQPAFCIESSGSTSKIALWSTAGCTQRPGYATTGTTSRTMNSTVTPAAVYSSDVGAQLNALQAVVKCLIQDLSAGTGLGLAASTV